MKPLLATPSHFDSRASALIYYVILWDLEGSFEINQPSKMTADVMWLGKLFKDGAGQNQSFRPPTTTDMLRTNASTQQDEMEKAMAPHSSILAWKIPWTEEPGRLWSMGSLRVGHDWATSLSFFTFTHWRRKWQPTPVFLPGESQGRGSLVGCRLWGCTEVDTTQVT